MTIYTQKILPERYRIIYEKWYKGDRTDKLSNEYGVTQSTINRIVQLYAAENNLPVRSRLVLPCRNSIVGQRFGELEVIKMSHSGEKRTPWKAICKCHACGKTDFECYPRCLRTRINKTCGCISWDRSKGKNNPNFTGYEEISGSNWNHIKKGAKIRRIDFDLRIEDIWNKFIFQNRKCALSGLPITFGESNYENRTASLDRIDSLKGYTIDNVQWVHKYINWMKNNHSQAFFIDLCAKVAINAGICYKRKVP